MIDGGLGGAFSDCSSLERITIPLKDGMIDDGAAFQECYNLKHVDIVDGAVIREIISALQLNVWRNDTNEEIDAINKILPKEEGEGKTSVIRGWIRSVLGKVIHYKAEHRRLLNKAVINLPIILPQDIVMNNVLSFLELPSYTFDLKQKWMMKRMTAKKRNRASYP